MINIHFFIYINWAIKNLIILAINFTLFANFAKFNSIFIFHKKNFANLIATTIIAITIIVIQIIIVVKFYLFTPIFLMIFIDLSVIKSIKFKIKTNLI